LSGSAAARQVEELSVSLIDKSIRMSFDQSRLNFDSVKTSVQNTVEPNAVTLSVFPEKFYFAVGI
jgi:hypothetical protein